MAKRKTKARRSPRPKARTRGASRIKRAASGKLPKEAVTLIVILRPREGQEILLEAELRALIGPTRREEGCISYELHRALEPPGGFLLHEVWASRDAHTEHMHTPHFLRWNARKDALLASRDGTFWQQIA
jgi:quinol monooxygenase YgiN